MAVPTPQRRSLSHSIVPLDMDATLIAVVEMGQKSWLVAGIVPGVARSPLKKLAVDQHALLQLLGRWRSEAERAGNAIARVTLAFEAGHDGFWPARWLMANGVDVHVIHASSVAVPREHRRAKTDRLDTEILKRAFVGWLRGERNHCKMVAVPPLAEEDAKRPSRERERLVAERCQIDTRLKAAFVRLGIRDFNLKSAHACDRLEDLRTPDGDPIPPNTLAEIKRDFARQAFLKQQIKAVEAARLERLFTVPGERTTAVQQLAQVVSIGVETADMLVQEVLSRDIADRRALARYAGLTGSPDESGARRREKGLARSGNARVRRGMIQLAWRFLFFQKQSALAVWWRERTEKASSTRKTIVVALARKLLIALWRFIRDGVVPDGVHLRASPLASA